ncbi:hypothetical protein Tco_0873426, partial [Tanacetum coccineum]
MGFWRAGHALARGQRVTLEMGFTILGFWPIDIHPWPWELISSLSDLRGLRNKSNHGFLAMDSKGGIPSLGESISGYGYSYENDPKTSCESTWSDSEVGDQPKRDATCLMEIKSQERHPDSCITDKVPTSFNQNDFDRLKAHIVKLRDTPKGVLGRSGLSGVWRNPMCDPVLIRSDNTVMSIYDFLCMPSLDKATVREEPHGLDTSILGRVADRTTSPALVGTAIPRASPKEIVVTRPNHKVVTKADHAAKRKASTRPEISTNVAKKTRSSKKGSGAGSSGLAAGDEVEQTDNGTLDNDD